MASETCDVAAIQDEDVLRRMWQQTDDFNRKKEIRAHMYKVREQRLKEFYTTGEVARDIQTSSTITTKNVSNRKHAETTHHADSLLDHSFQSLKSKEIRDSASPTKELTTFNKSLSQDHGWNIKEATECSKDGKTQTHTRLATTSGSKEIPGGVANYAAKNEAVASVYQDGDDKNFKKSAGTTNTSVLKQEAHGADGNTSFRSSSTSSKTSSHYVSEQKSTQPERTIVTKTTQGYVPDEVLRDPNTKVYTETKTLPDGTRVTTTRYETTGAQKQTSSRTTKSEVKQHRQQQEQRSHVQQEHTKRVVENVQHQQQQHQQLQQQQQLHDQKHVEQLHEHKQVQQHHKEHRNENVQTHREHHQRKESHHQETNLRDVQSKNEQIIEKTNQLIKNEREAQRRAQEEHVEKTRICVKPQPTPSTPKTETVETITTVVTKTVNGTPEDINVSRRSSVQTDNRRSSVQTDSRRDSVKTTKTINVEKVEDVRVQSHKKEETVKTSNYTTQIDNKRVSVDISPTHDAFVRSLRSVTPERDRKPLHPGRTSSPEKKFRLSPDRKNSHQFASNETITKSVHTTTRRSDYESKRRTSSRSVSPHEPDRVCRPVISSKVVERSPTSPTKKSPTGTRRPSNEDKPRPDKVLRRTDTYEERVRQILGIAEKKKPKPEKSVTDIITSDRNANRKPSVPDVGRRPSKSPEKKPQEYPAQKRKSLEQPERRPSSGSPTKDIFPQTNWLPSAPRQTPERKTDRKTPDRVGPHATATAKEIRKYHGGSRTCSPAIDLQDASDQLDRGTISPGRDEAVINAFTTAKNGKVYSVDFINVEKEMVSKERSSVDRTFQRQTPERMTPERKSPERRHPERASPKRVPPLLHVSGDTTPSGRMTPTRATPQRLSPERMTPERVIPEYPYQERPTTERISPERMTPTRMSPERKSVERSQVDTESKQTKQNITKVMSKEHDLLESTSKRGSVTKQNIEDELMEQTTKYIQGDDEEAPESLPKKQSPSRTIDDDIVTNVETIETTTTKQKSVKKDLSRDMERKKEKITEDITQVEVTTSPQNAKKSPIKKKPSTKDIYTSQTDEHSRTTTTTATINLEPASETGTTPKVQSKHTVGNKMSKPKTAPKEVPETPKCISTKSIIINEAVAEQREIIVDLKRSKSSREDSPEKVWPVQTEEDSGIPRYPDQIQEPEDRRGRKMKKVNDIVINEDEHVEEFNRITELVDTEITDVDRVAETDECLLTVNEKVNKFQNVTKGKGAPKKPKGPAPKVTRPEFTVDETLVEDDCLLSVSDKVHKFKTTAEQLTVDPLPERPKSPRCQFNKEKVTTKVERKVEQRDVAQKDVTEKVVKSTVTEEHHQKPSSKVKTPGTNVQAPEETPKSSKKVYLSSVGKLRSTESIKKARDLFEVKKDVTETTRKQPAKQPQTTAKPTDRSVPKGVKLDDIGVESTPVTTDRKHLDHVRKTLVYEEDESVPGYMKQLDRTLRITSPHRDSVMELEAISKGHTTHQTTDESVKTTKFGVTLRRTDSGSKTTTTDRKEVTTININGVQKEVEEVYDLEILENMLETVTNYELRRRIRFQIRIVKKMISEGKLTTSTTVRRRSPEKVQSTVERKSAVTRKSSTTETETIKRDEYVKKEQRKSPEKVSFKPFRRSPERQAEPKSKKDDRPDWVRERPLRKASERVMPSTHRTTTSTTTIRKEARKERSSPVKENRGIDAITSCYGIGPTDENGMPLFGLKALRAHNTNKSKVQGQVTKSTFYSENGQEPVGEVTVTKYSTDARDLGPGTIQSHTNGISSKTTTQKIGKQSAITSKNVSSKKNDERTTKVTRRNSVKEMTQKFIDNTAESCSAERKNTYKAGLILRTSSFKERQSSSRESSPEMTPKTGSFLTNTSKVTGMQDVITRMRTEEHVEGDTQEDAEARQLLNKFLGSQVILAGMEGGGSGAPRGSFARTGATRTTTSTSASTATQGSTGKRTTKVTTTVTENGVPKTSTRTFTHPVTQEVLETVWEEQTLRLLLEQSTEYEERRIIRARLKQVMAEKEACAEFTEKALEEAQSGNVHGESLLLPLLHNALEPPEFEQTADSGTESGEDLRSGLILEVQSALEKLSACLCSDSSDISQERRNSLLQLVSKLQTNLAVPAPNREGGDAVENAGTERRLSGGGGGGRFARRQQRQRNARHTVGVTSEELEDARRLMEEFVLSNSQENVPALQEKLEERPASYRPVKMGQGVRNAMPKPFANSSTSSGTSSIVQTPSNDSLDHSLQLTPTHDDISSNDRYCYKQSMSYELPEEPKPKLVHAFSLDCGPNAELISAVQQAASLKVQPDTQESETDEDTLRNEIMLPASYQVASPPCQPNQLRDGDTVVLYDQGIYPPAAPILAPIVTSPILAPPPIVAQPSLPAPVVTPPYEESIVLQPNPIYNNEIEKSNRFNAKKSRMKRANTIDIPKPSNYYFDDGDSEGELTEPETSSRRSNYLALRGPIRVGNKANPAHKVPSFEPKTESDKKFLAFINRQNANAGVSNKISLWDKASQNQSHSSDESGTNWTRKFGNIKTNFERVASDNPTHTRTHQHDTQNRNSARNFWKTTETKQTTNYGAKNLRQRFEADTPQNNNKHTNLGSPKVTATQKNNKFVPQPLPVNKFTHNPNESAFKPINKTNKPDVIANIKSNGSESSTPETPLYLYSPKSFEVQSPVHNSAPWNSKSASQPYAPSGERRVLSLAASKFEAPSANVHQEETKFVPRKLSKEKITVPTSLLHNNNKTEKLVAYVPPVTKAGGVRKLSGQYDNMDANSTAKGEYVSQSNVKYKSAFASVPQNRNTQHQKQQQHKDNMYNKYAIPPHTNTAYDKYNSQNSTNSMHPERSSNETIPPSFHTTSPQVQNIQMRHGHSNDVQSNVYYNNVHPHSPIHYNNSVDYHNHHEFQQTPQTQPLYQHPTTNDYQVPVQPMQNHTEYAPKVDHRSPPIQKEHEPHIYYNNVTYQPPHTQPRKEQTQSVEQTHQPPKTQQRPHYDSQTSTESVHEYLAVSSKVMSGPVSQQAVTVTNKPKSRDEHDMDAALNLRNALQMKTDPKPKSPYTPKFCVNDEPLSLDTLEVNARGESIVTAKFQIPAHAQNETKLQAAAIPQQRVSPTLSKSDSWHQVVQKEQIAKKPSPRASPNARTVQKSKSTHALAVPKQFEAGMSKDEMLLKKRTMEAYFGAGGVGGGGAPMHKQHHMAGMGIGGGTSGGSSSHKRSINRVKTSQKISTATTEKIVSTKTFTEGPMARTQTVTTRVATQQQISKKPMSPFAKFRQMDRQNSANTPPSTPKTPMTPTGGGPMFKFTDPNLSQSASTIKERLLHWCQMKTREYDNIKLENFSTCWADGLAFCALIHHFLPDAFDYSKLTPNNRRHNFTLAFQVADEKADIAPLLDVDDMVATRRPDWKCVFTYVQSIYRRFKDQD